MTASAVLMPHLPLLRRYARALSGSQAKGDAYVKASLEALLAGKVKLAGDIPARIALYQLFHTLWSSAAGGMPDSSATDVQTGVERRLQALQPTNREALLLTAVEGFSVSETALILGWSETDVDRAITAALQAIDRELASNVLIVEDESIIAMDLENLVTDLGHSVTGVATTYDEAVHMAAESKPDLLLSDIQLADGSSGLDAAVTILKSLDIPVIFITAYPERLLTGSRPEPTYVFTKPFSRDMVKATIGQALFFHKSLLPA